MAEFKNFEEIWDEALAQASVNSTDPVKIFVNLLGSYLAEQVSSEPEVAEKIKELTTVDPKEDLYVIDASSGTIVPLHSCYVLRQSALDAECLDSASDLEICTFAVQNGERLFNLIKP